jgi:hypothetical protein
MVRFMDVRFERAWLDPVAGKVFCLSSGRLGGMGRS